MRLKDEPNFFDPRFCSYKLSGKTRSHVERLIESHDVEGDTKERLREVIEEDEDNKNTLSYETLSKLHKYLQRADKMFIDTPFWVFKDSCKCIKPKPRTNKDLETRLNKLRLKESQFMYDKSVRDVDKEVENKLTRSAHSKIVKPGDEFRALDGSLMAVINSFLVYICTFVFCYKAVEYSLMEPNIIAQVLFGLLGSTVVAIAELYFLMRVI